MMVLDLRECSQVRHQAFIAGALAGIKVALQYDFVEKTPMEVAKMIGDRFITRELEKEPRKP